MKHLKAVIFDWAGTTIDYGCFAPVGVFMRVFEAEGVSITPAQARAPMGLEKRDHIRAIVQDPMISEAWQATHGRAWHEDDVARMYHATLDIQIESVVRYAQLIDGTLDAVRFCREHGLKIGSSTGYNRTIMEALLPLAREQGYAPDSVVCPSDVPSGRPAPYMMYQNALNLAVYPFSQVVKVGDTVPDIEEAQSVGAWMVAVSQTGNALGMSAEEVAQLDSATLEAHLAPIEARFYEAGAHAVIRTIADLPAVLEAIDAGELSRG
jgi:phosphonoacetaldehyde hydrolase